MEILGFDDLVLKCYFFMSNKLLNIEDNFLTNIVWQNGMELNSYIWDNVWTCLLYTSDAADE